MKRTVTISLLTLAVSLLALGQMKSSSTDKLIEDIKKMDRQWIIEAYSSKDLKDFDRIVADDFLITGGNGKVQTKAEKRASVAADYTEFAPDAIFKIDEDSAKVRVFGSTAISSGFIVENYTYQNQKINRRVYFTNTYLERNGRWQVVASQFTNVRQQ